MYNRGMLIIISGPSGSGKGTVVKALDPNKDYALSRSVTTRKIRDSETDGVDYFFKSVEEFEMMRESHEFLEHACFCGNFYGTPKSYVQQQIAAGKTVVLEIEVNGALQVKQRFPDAILIFLMPPTFLELAKRLINRNTENKETIEDRLNRAREEIKLIDKYDYLVVNDTVKNAVDLIDSIVCSESLRPKRNDCVVKNFMGDE